MDKPEQPIKVMVISDQAEGCGLILAGLHPEKYDCLFVGSGKAPVDPGSETIDVIVLDTVSDEDALSGFSNVRERYPDTPIVLLLTGIDEVLEERLLSLDSMDWIIKGEMGAASVRSAVRNALERIREGSSDDRSVSEEQYLRIRSGLIHSHALLSSIMEGSPDIMVYALDTQYRYMAFNQRYRNEMTAIRGKEVSIGSNILESFDGSEDRMKAKENYDRALAGGSFDLIGEYGVEGFPRQSWHEYWSPIYTGDEIIGLTCLALDLTGMKQAEEGLNRNLSLIQAILESIDNGVLAVDLKGTILNANRRFAEMWNIPQDIIDSKEDARLIKHVLDQLVDPGSFIIGVERLYLTPEAGMQDILQFKDGRVFERTSAPMMVKGKPFGRVWSFLDITSAKRAEERLTDSREQLQATLYSIGDGVISTDRMGKVIDLNPVAEDLMGWKAHEARGKRIEDVFRIINTDTNAVVENPIRAAMQEKRIIGLANHTDLVSKDGSVRHIADSCAPICNSEGDVVGSVLVFRDVTEQYRVNKELGRQNGLFKSLLESLPVGVFMVEAPSGKPLVANEAAVRMLGRGIQSDANASNIGEIYNSFKESTHSPYPAEEMPVIQGMLGRSTHVNDMVVVRPDGIESLLEVTGTPILDDDGNVWASLVNFADITESRLSERQAVLQQARLALALEASGDGIWDLNLSTMEMTVNPRFHTMLGYPPDNLTFHFDNALELVHPDDKADLLSIMKALEQTSVGYHRIELRLLAADGNWRWLLIRYKIVEVSSSGAPLRVIGINTDTTEGRLREEELRFLSNHDKLTGLFNRRYAEKYLKDNTLAGVVPLTLIMGDVNGLKLINDTFGHAEGDRLLLGFSMILKRSVKDKGVISRWGGDEFLIILPGFNGSQAKNLIRSIQEECRNHSVEPFPLSVAMGYATRQNGKQTVEDVMRDAEERMYHGKLIEGKSARSAIITALRESLSSKTHETDEHCERMQMMARRVAEHMGLPDNIRDDTLLLALLHDIGKIGIPESILTKPDRLTPEEMNVIRKHSEIGFRIAKASYEIAHIAESILSHHEWWDGSGYPQGLVGERIPLISRIVSVIDALDAMTSDRSYRNTLSIQEAVQEIKRCSGTQFDPSVVEVLVRLLS